MTFNNARIDRLDVNWCYLASAGKIIVTEDDDNGKATVTFETDFQSLHLKHLDDKPPLKWMNNRKCADDAIIQDTENGFVLHVIELKSHLTRKEWIKVRKQFEGMVANALAMLAVIEAEKPIQVFAHVSFKSESVDSAATADPIFLKMPIGSQTQLGAVTDWRSQSVRLIGYTAELRLIPRDPETGLGVGNLAAA